MTSQCLEFSSLPAYRLAASKIQGEIARKQGLRAVALGHLREAAALEPSIAYREYLLEALDPSDPERRILSHQIVSNPWLFVRDPTLEAPGVQAKAVEVTLNSDSQNQTALAIQRSLRKLTESAPELKFK